jgi:phospholipid-binding lipoprotein MlaA
LKVADPLYIWNKGMYHINDKLYFWVLKPLAKGYKAITPDIFREGVSNFFYNLMMPIRFVNCIGNGFYLVWPILGPTTLRDFIGEIGDAYLNPLIYIDPIEAELAVRGFNYINKTSFHIGEYEALKEASVDPYVAMRNSYLQFRERKIKQ